MHTRDDHGNGILNENGNPTGIQWEWEQDLTWEWEWKGVGMTPIYVGKISTDFLNCCRSA